MTFGLGEGRAASVAAALRENADRVARMEGILGSEWTGVAFEHFEGVDEMGSSDDGSYDDDGEVVSFPSASLLATALQPLLGSPLLTSVERLRFSGCSVLEQRDLDSLVTMFPRLTDLNLGQTRLAAHMLRGMVCLPWLCELYVNVETRADLEALMDACRAAQLVRTSLLRVGVATPNELELRELMDMAQLFNIESVRRDEACNVMINLGFCLIVDDPNRVSLTGSLSWSEV